MAEKTPARQPRFSFSRIARPIGTGLVDGFAGALALLVTAALVWAWTTWRPDKPSPELLAQWESQILQDITIVEKNAHRTTWRQMPGGQLDIYVIGNSVRKLVRHQRYQASREYFFVGDTLTFVFIRGDENRRFGRAEQGSGHRYFFHPHPQWMADDTLRMFTWVAPGNARVDTDTPQFTAAERMLASEAAELWKAAHEHIWQRRSPVEVRDTGDGAPPGPGDEG